MRGGSAGAGQPISQRLGSNRLGRRTTEGHRFLIKDERRLVDYYRCGDCGHVWNVPKDPDAEPQHVTPLRDAQ
jgi:hypothetical protein